MELIAAQSGEAGRKSAVHFRRWLGDDDKRGVNESDRDSLWSHVDDAKSGLSKSALHCLTCCCCFVADLLAGGECFLLPPHNMNVPLCLQRVTPLLHFLFRTCACRFSFRRAHLHFFYTTVLQCCATTCCYFFLLCSFPLSGGCVRRGGFWILGSIMQQLRLLLMKLPPKESPPTPQPLRLLRRLHPQLLLLLLHLQPPPLHQPRPLHCQSRLLPPPPRTSTFSEVSPL